MCLEAALYDPVFLHRALEFCSRQLTFIVNIINPNLLVIQNYWNLLVVKNHEMYTAKYFLVIVLLSFPVICII